MGAPLFTLKMSLWASNGFQAPLNFASSNAAVNQPRFSCAAARCRARFDAWLTKLRAGDLVRSRGRLPPRASSCPGSANTAIPPRLGRRRRPHTLRVVIGGVAPPIPWTLLPLASRPYSLIVPPAFLPSVRILVRLLSGGSPFLRGRRASAPGPGARSAAAGPGKRPRAGATLDHPAHRRQRHRAGGSKRDVVPYSMPWRGPLARCSRWSCMSLTPARARGRKPPCRTGPLT